jgi:signal peptidase I
MSGPSLSNNSGLENNELLLDPTPPHGKRSGNAVKNGASTVALELPETNADGSGAATPPTSARQEIVSFVKTVAIFLVLAFFLRASVVEAFKIPSLSMAPTLQVGDHILVSKLSYGIRLPFVSRFVYQYDEPERGDIIVFTREDDPDINIIKRVVGVPGDLVEIRNRKVTINNQLLYEPYARYRFGGIKNFGPERVPSGHLFMLGDNRDESRDSRFWDDSPWLDIQSVKGRAHIIYWTFDKDWRERIGKILR